MNSEWFEWKGWNLCWVRSDIGRSGLERPWVEERKFSPLYSAHILWYIGLTYICIPQRCICYISSMNMAVSSWAFDASERALRSKYIAIISVIYSLILIFLIYVSFCLCRNLKSFNVLIFWKKGDWCCLHVWRPWKTFCISYLTSIDLNYLTYLWGYYCTLHYIVIVEVFMFLCLPRVFSTAYSALFVVL